MPGIWDSQTWTNTDPRLQQAFLAMAAAAPGTIGLTSGWRSNAQQTALHNQKPNLAAAPGHSNHEFGLAIDMTFQNDAVKRWVHQNASRFGLWFPMDYEPWHVQLIGVDRHNINNPNAMFGGGRDAFSPSPESNFVNPYDALGSAMQVEDNTDPMTQFERLMNAMHVPGTASPDTSLMDSPTMESGSMEAEDVAGQMVSAADVTPVKV